MRFLKAVGEMGPKTTKSLVSMTARIQTVKLGENDSTPITEESLRTACEANGALVLYSTSPQAQCFTGVSNFCHRAGLQTWVGDTKMTKPENVGSGLKMTLLPTEPDNIVAVALLHQPKRQTAGVSDGSKVMNFMKPEIIAELTPAQRNAIVQNIKAANELDSQDLHNFANEVTNKAAYMKKSSRQSVLAFMDKLIARDRQLSKTSVT